MCIAASSKAPKDTVQDQKKCGQEMESKNTQQEPKAQHCKLIDMRQHVWDLDHASGRPRPCFEHCMGGGGIGGNMLCSLSDRSPCRLRCCLALFLFSVFVFCLCPSCFQSSSICGLKSIKKLLHGFDSPDPSVHFALQFHSSNASNSDKLVCWCLLLQWLESSLAGVW